MNSIRAIVRLSLRGYRTNGSSRRSTRDSSKKRHIEMIQPSMPFEKADENENDDFEDLDKYESNFSNVAEYHRMHERELSIAKKKLKNVIVKRKYFKSVEPSMVTWGEKEQMRLLHKEDPDEWSPDKLSDSFPASREAVLKILRADWLPKSTKIVEKYDKTVKENWDLFRAGKLAIDPELRAHLENFKNRDITIMSEEGMKKFLKPKPIFRKPDSVVFSSIIESYSGGSTAIKERKGIEKRVKKITKELPERITSGNDDDARAKSRKKSNDCITYDMFLRKHVEGVNKNEITTIDRVIVDEYKEKNAEDYKLKSLIHVSRSASDARGESELSYAKDNETSSSDSIEAPSLRETTVRVIDEGSTETGIIARQKKENAAPDDYPEFIKIPKNKYKRGVTYRVEDRYYDDNGEFLYRVYGLHT